MPKRDTSNPGTTLKAPSGNPKSPARIAEKDVKRRDLEMIKIIVYIHSKGLWLSDLRLDQWLVDADLNARLSDLTALGFDGQPDLVMAGKLAQGMEAASHCLRLDPQANDTVTSDLFTLGSTLYELLAGRTSYEG